MTSGTHQHPQYGCLLCLHSFVFVNSPIFWLFLVQKFYNFTIAKIFIWKLIHRLLTEKFKKQNKRKMKLLKREG